MSWMPDKTTRMLDVPIQQSDRVYRRFLYIREVNEADIALLSMDVPVQVRDLDVDLQRTGQRRHLYMI